MSLGDYLGLAVLVFCAYYGFKGIIKGWGSALFPSKTNAIAPEAIKEATEEKPLAMRVWLDYVNNQPDSVPHVAVIGPSGSGKTTLTTAILNDRTGNIVIISGKDGDTWGGLTAIGIDDDLSYTTAERMFGALLAEVKRRKLAAKQQHLTADWLTIVVDDFSTLNTECASASDVVKLVARIGRSLRIRLVMLSDSALVKSIGLEGEGETRGNFAFIRLKRGYKATLDIEDAAIPIDTRLGPQLAQRSNLSSRAWSMPRSEAEELAELLITTQGDGAFQPSQEGSSSNNGGSNGDITLSRYNKVLSLLLSGASQSQIASDVGVSLSTVNLISKALKNGITDNH